MGGWSREVGICLVVEKKKGNHKLELSRTMISNSCNYLVLCSVSTELKIYYRLFVDSRLSYYLVCHCLITLVDRLS